MNSSFNVILMVEKWSLSDTLTVKKQEMCFTVTPSSDVPKSLEPTRIFLSGFVDQDFDLPDNYGFQHGTVSFVVHIYQENPVALVNKIKLLDNHVYVAISMGKDEILKLEKKLLTKQPLSIMIDAGFEGQTDDEGKDIGRINSLRFTLYSKTSTEE